MPITQCTKFHDPSQPILSSLNTPRLGIEDAELVAHMLNAARDIYTSAMRAVVCEVSRLAVTG